MMELLRRKLDGVVESIPPEKGCEVLNGELTVNNGLKMTEKFADSDDSYIWLKWGEVVIKFSKAQYGPHN